MTVHNHVTLSDSTDTLLTPAGTHSGLDVTIQNIDAAAIVYIGGEGVTASDYGFKLVAGNAISFELPPKDALYAISNTNGSKVSVLKTGLED